MKTNNEKNIFSILILTLSIIIFSCGKDTCNDDKSVFYSIDLDSAHFDTKQLVVYFSTDVNKQLPVNYFADHQINSSVNDPYGKNWQNNSSDIDSIIFSPSLKDPFHITNLIVYLKKNHFLTSSNQNVGIHFVFPDRRGYMACKHPGGPDRYNVDLSFMISISSNDIIQTSSFQWEQKFHPGPY